MASTACVGVEPERVATLQAEEAVEIVIQSIVAAADVGGDEASLGWIDVMTWITQPQGLLDQLVLTCI